MADASSRNRDKQFMESIYNVKTDYEEQPFIKENTHSVYISKNLDQVGSMINDHENKKQAQGSIRITTRPVQRPASAFGARGNYYGGLDKPITGRRDTNGYFGGRFITAQEANDNGVNWTPGLQMIADSISKVAQGQSYGQNLRHSTQEPTMVRFEDAEENQYAPMQKNNGLRNSARNENVTGRSYYGPSRPQSALGPRYTGLTRAQSTPFIEPGSGYIADNNTFMDFTSNVSEKTNKLKKNIYGQRFGNYSNRPLTAMNTRKQPLIRPSTQKSAAQGRELAISKDLRNYYEEKHFRDTMYLDGRTGEVPKSKGNNKMIEGLMRYRKSIEGQPQLYDGLLRLKQIDLLKNKQNKIKTNKFWPQKEYIYNDYYDKSTKDGYNRNALGTFFYH